MSCVHFGLVEFETVWFLWDCLWDFRWPVNTSLEMGVFEEEDGAVVGVVWLLPSGLASSPLRILSKHFLL